MIRQPEYVGIDLHRRRSVIVRQDHDAKVLETVRIDNDPLALAAAIADAGPHPEVVVEATGGWYWAADGIEDCGARLHLSHPKGNDWGHQRVQNDVRDAEDLADLLRLGRLAEAWVALKEIRELRELTRYRLKVAPVADRAALSGPLGVCQRGRERPDDRSVRQGRTGATRQRGVGRRVRHPGGIAARPAGGLRP